MDVGIVGGSGYGGAELLRLLGGHPSLKVRTVAARAGVGRRVGEVLPHLLGGPNAELVFAPPEVEALAGCDLVLLATPHEASLQLAPALLEAGARVIDLSGAFRLDAETFADSYGSRHPAAEHSPAAYGLPELYRAEIAAARLVANPGCYPTATLLALAPLATAPGGPLVDPDSVVVAGLSGTSGAGKGLREDLHVSHAVGNVAPYGAPTHRHTPEIAAIWGRLAGRDNPRVTFVPHLVPMARGEVCTVVADLAAGTDPAMVREAYADRYTSEPFVQVLDEGVWPHSTHLVGSNGVHVGVAVDTAARRVVVAAAVDNLLKGAAGQALQNANLLAGLPETAGLPIQGVYP